MEARCRRHPKHRQSPGVCPSCLRERLSRLSASSSTQTSYTFSSPGTTCDSLSSSAASSSPNTPSGRRHRRNTSARIPLLTKENGKSQLLGKVKVPLTRSRSCAFVIALPLCSSKEKQEKGEAGREEERESVSGKKTEEMETKKKKKGRGFWSKLAVGGKKRKEKDALFHSKTVRETASARWTFPA